MARLKKQDWLDHGLEQLAEDGFPALKADLLAKSLGVSRGSFYWHFEDLAQFHTDILNRWLELTVLSFVGLLEASDLSSQEKLATLIEQASVGDRRTEQAIRSWAFSEESVRTMVELVDNERLKYITGLIKEIHQDDERAEARAFLVYLSSVGYYAISDLADDALRKQTISELISYAIETST